MFFRESFIIQIVASKKSVPTTTLREEIAIRERNLSDRADRKRYKVERGLPPTRYYSYLLEKKNGVREGATEVIVGGGAIIGGVVANPEVAKAGGVILGLTAADNMGKVLFEVPLHKRNIRKARQELNRRGESI